MSLTVFCAPNAMAPPRPRLAVNAHRGASTTVRTAQTTKTAHLGRIRVTPASRVENCWYRTLFHARDLLPRTTSRGEISRAIAPSGLATIDFPALPPTPAILPGARSLVRGHQDSTLRDFGKRLLAFAVAEAVRNHERMSYVPRTRFGQLWMRVV
jgi:hypothetical protein